MSKTILIMAGGTGGHIFPALAVAHKMREAGWRVVWLGNPDGMEARLVPQHGFEMVWVKFSALRGKGLLRKLMLPFNLLRGFWQGLKAIRQVRPHVVLGMGGYITFPGGMMAALTGVPLVLHEQNSVAGLANKVLAGVADKIVTGFPDVLAKGQWLGNPVRPEIANLPAPAERFAERSGPLRVQAHCVPFIEDMQGAYEWADLVICRAGALTVAELAAAGVASILVPFPHAVDDHQTSNAKFLVHAGGAFLLPQNELTPEAIALIRNYARGQLLEMAEKARSLAKPDATADVATLCAESAK